MLQGTILESDLQMDGPSTLTITLHEGYTFPVKGFRITCFDPHTGKTLEMFPPSCALFFVCQMPAYAAHTYPSTGTSACMLPTTLFYSLYNLGSPGELRYCNPKRCSTDRQEHDSERRKLHWKCMLSKGARGNPS